jgi:predicted amidophosphoribosyltransferase
MHELIVMLKYEKYEVLGFRIGAALAKIWPRPDADVLVPVPLHLSSRRRYNQAEALARGFGNTWGIDVMNAARWTVDVASLAATRAAARRQNLSSGQSGVPSRFTANRPEQPLLPKDVFPQDVFAFDDIAGLRIGLVDDVCTSGKTLFRLAEAAGKSGAEVAGAFVAAFSLLLR